MTAQRRDEVPREVLEVLEGRRQWAIVHAEAWQFLRSLPPECIDAVVTDSPYSSGGQFRGERAKATEEKYVHNSVKVTNRHGDFAGDTRDQRGFLMWSALWLTDAYRVAKSGAPLCTFTDWRQLPVTTDAVQAGGWIWRGIVPWDKTAGCRPSMGRFAAQCEYVVWGSKGDMPVERGVGALPGVVRCFPNPHDKHHIAGKPVEMLCEIVRIAPLGAVVLDPYMGSGSTGVACINEGMRFIGVELLAANIAKTRRRLEAAERGQLRIGRSGA